MLFVEKMGKSPLSEYKGFGVYSMKKKQAVGGKFLLLGQCGKLSEKLFSTFSNPCFEERSFITKVTEVKFLSFYEGICKECGVPDP